MTPKRKDPPGSLKFEKENLVVEDFVTSEVKELRGVRAGAKIVWTTLIISAILFITTAVFISLLVALFLFPESRQEILRLIERLIVELWSLLGA